MQHPIRIGTRGSPLALAQAHEVRDRLVAAHEGLTADMVEIHVIKTTGDRILDRPLTTAGGKGLFTKEIEDALLDGSIALAVHSSKDMPTRLPAGLVLSTFLEREDVRDVFISPKAQSFMELPEGAVLGTASLRRRALALRLRPDLNVVTFRGNVQTRLSKLEGGEADATFLARAGLNRLGMEAYATETLSLDDFMPAPAQGAVCVEIREGDDATRALLAPLHHHATAVAVTAERAFLAALDGSCRTPIAAYATLKGGEVQLKAMLVSLDGKIVFAEEGTAPEADAAALGHRLGHAVRARAGEAFFEELAAGVAALVS